jgi:Mn-dependent DtxR family transcriptional regulator
MQDWRRISKDAVLEAVCQCSHDAQGNTASWECIASKLAISFPKHVYSLCEELEEQGLVLRVARFIRLTEMGTAHCKARLIASEGSVDEEPPIAGKVWDL